MENSEKSTKLITAKQVQEEYLDVDIRKVRAFLNKYCHYRKIGRQYFYVRQEVEEKLLDTGRNVEYDLKERIHISQMPERRRKR